MNKKNEPIDFELIENENCLLNSWIVSILLYNDSLSNRLATQLILRPQIRKFKGQIQFNFFNVRTFCWYHKDDISLGYIERYKLLRLKNGFYLSLDPFDEYSTVSSDKDNNVIIAEKVERSFLNPSNSF